MLKLSLIIKLRVFPNIEVENIKESKLIRNNLIKQFHISRMELSTLAGFVYKNALYASSDLVTYCRPRLLP